MKRGGLPEPVRGLVLLLSLLLWAPVLRALLAGEMRVDEAVLRYAAALLVAWGGCALLAGLVRAYTPEPPDEQPASAGHLTASGSTGSGPAAGGNGTAPSTGPAGPAGAAAGTGTGTGSAVAPDPAEVQVPQRRVSDRAE